MTKAIWWLLLSLPCICQSQILKESMRVQLIDQTISGLFFYEYAPQQMFVPYYLTSDSQYRFGTYVKGESHIRSNTEPNFPGQTGSAFSGPLPIAGITASDGAALVARGPHIGVGGGPPGQEYVKSVVELSDLVPYDSRFNNSSLACTTPGAQGTQPVCAYAWNDTNHPQGDCGATFCPETGYIHVVTTKNGNFADPTSFARWESGKATNGLVRVAFVGTRLYVAWIGMGGNRPINIAYSDDYSNFSNVITEDAQSALSLSITGINGHLVVGFIGTDNHINLHSWSGQVNSRPDLHYFISPTGGFSDTETGGGIALSPTSDGLLVSWKNTQTYLAWVTIPFASKGSKHSKRR